jgi:hypothetical protein
MPESVMKRHFSLEARDKVFNLIERIPKTAASQRVERILELIVMAEKCRSKIHRDGMEHGVLFEGSEHFDDPDRIHSPLWGFRCRLPLYSFTDPAIEEINLQLRDVLRELQSLLIRYQWRPTVEDRLYGALDERLLWDKTKSANSEENRAVQFVLQQIDHRWGPPKIRRFRKCLECSAWFYAITDRRMYCGESCRKRNASHNPEFKKKRAEYMRTKYRPEVREQNRRALELARESLSERKTREKGRR